MLLVYVKCLAQCCRLDQFLAHSMPLVGDRAIDARAIGKRSYDALADSSLPVLRRDEAFLCEGARVLKAQVACAALTGQRVSFELERP